MYSMTEVTLTEFRKELFKLADQVIDSGEPVRFRPRRGRTLELRVVESERPRTRQEWWAHYLSVTPESDFELPPDEELSVNPEEWMDEWLEEHGLKP